MPSAASPWISSESTREVARVAAIPEQLLTRFRAIALERLARAETTWLALTRGEDVTDGTDDDLFRDIHTLKGDAHLAGFTDVGTLCQRLEDLLVLARTHGFRVHDDVDVAVKMAIQRIGLLVRKPPGARLGVDSDGPRVQLPEPRAVMPRGVRVETLPLTPLLVRHAGVARDLARGLGKEVEVACDEVDLRVHPEVQEVLNTMLLHTLRNAIDHGIELPSARARAGKPSAGKVSVRVTSEQGMIGLAVRDDGAGVDFAEVRRLAAARGILAPEEAERADEARLIELLFHPRFSTRETAGPISGRGIGMDAVRTAVERVGGRVELTTTPGQGTAVTLVAPEMPRGEEVPRRAGRPGRSGLSRRG